MSSFTLKLGPYFSKFLLQVETAQARLLLPPTDEVINSRPRQKYQHQLVMTKRGILN